MNVPPVPLWAIIVAAGSGSRMGNALEIPKQFMLFEGVPLYWHSARSFARSGLVHGLVFVFPEACCAAEETRLRQLFQAENLGIPWCCVAGGASRQESVHCGLTVLRQQNANACLAVMVHDAARPFFTPSLIRTLVEALRTGYTAVIPALALTDTIKEVYAQTVQTTLDRSRLFAAQTPQLFLLDALYAAHMQALQQGWTATDDAHLLELCGVAVHIVEGETANRKITHPEDLAMLEEKVQFSTCTGWGYDVHRYACKNETKSGQSSQNRPMKIGGVLIPNAPELIAHSDGDVLLHALMDALLGSIGQGDIGTHFPDTSAVYENCNSAIMLDEVMRLLQAAAARITHVDCTIIAQIPRIQPHVAAIRGTLAHLLGLDAQSVNIKATTEEGLGFTGEKKGIKAVAVVSIERSHNKKYH